MLSDAQLITNNVMPFASFFTRAIAKRVAEDLPPKFHFSLATAFWLASDS
jgi:hypothetical protein